MSNNTVLFQLVAKSCLRILVHTYIKLPTLIGSETYSF